MGPDRSNRKAGHSSRRAAGDPTKVKPPRKKAAKSKKAQGGGLDSAGGSEAQPTTADLLQHSTVTTEEWYKSARTTQVYANYVKSGKKWLGVWVSEDRQGQSIEGDASASTIEDRESFAGAFDTLCGNTPIALRLLLAFKCDVQKNGFATAEGLRSAFKQYFER